MAFGEFRRRNGSSAVNAVRSGAPQGFGQVGGGGTFIPTDAPDLGMPPMTQGSGAMAPQAPKLGPRRQSLADHAAMRSKARATYQNRAFAGQADSAAAKGQSRQAMAMENAAGIGGRIQHLDMAPYYAAANQRYGGAAKSTASTPMDKAKALEIYAGVNNGDTSGFEDWWEKSNQAPGAAATPKGAPPTGAPPPTTQPSTQSAQVTATAGTANAGSLGPPPQQPQRDRAGNRIATNRIGTPDPKTGDNAVTEQQLREMWRASEQAYPGNPQAAEADWRQKASKWGKLEGDNATNLLNQWRGTTGQVQTQFQNGTQTVPVPPQPVVQSTPNGQIGGTATLPNGNTVVMGPTGQTVGEPIARGPAMPPASYQVPVYGPQQGYTPIQGSYAPPMAPSLAAKPTPPATQPTTRPAMPPAPDPYATPQGPAMTWANQQGDVKPYAMQSTPAQSGGAIPQAEPPARPVAGNPALAMGQPVRIQSDAEFAALPSGTEFIAPDGTRRRKP
jgi:hypothetical protein